MFTDAFLTKMCAYKVFNNTCSMKELKAKCILNGYLTRRHPGKSKYRKEEYRNQSGKRMAETLTTVCKIWALSNIRLTKTGYPSKLTEAVLVW